jgi:hypothetical protein
MVLLIALGSRDGTLRRRGVVYCAAAPPASDAAARPMDGFASLDRRSVGGLVKPSV